MMVFYFFYFSFQIYFDSSLFILFLNAFAKFRNATIIFVISVRLPVRLSITNNLATTGRIFMKVYWVSFENLYLEFKFLKNPTRIKGTLHTDVCTFFIPRPLLRVTYASKLFWETRHAYFVFNNIFLKVVPFMK